MNEKKSLLCREDEHAPNLESFGLPPVRELARGSLARVDLAVIGYQRKLAGVDPWPDFELPPSLREAQRAA